MRQALKSALMRGLSAADALYRSAAAAYFAARGRDVGDPGYAAFKEQTLARAVTDAATCARLAAGDPSALLADAARLDERIVEYPWVLGRLDPAAVRVLDAGSALNFDWLAPSLRRGARTLMHYTLAPEPMLADGWRSYVHGDLRALLLADGCMDAVVCLSTLEHVGMDNARYADGPAAAPGDPDAGQRQVMAEFGRVLRPGGQLLLTVPYGQPRALGWLRPFDAAALAAAVAAFPGAVTAAHYLRRGPNGWVRSTAEGCADARYVDDPPPAGSTHRRTYAEAVVCLECRRAAA